MRWAVSTLARLAVLLAWILTPLLGRAYDGGFWGFVLPLLGVLVVPFTILTYAVVHALAHGVNGWAWGWVVLAFFIDVAANSQSATGSRRVRAMSRT